MARVSCAEGSADDNIIEGLEEDRVVVNDGNVNLWKFQSNASVWVAD